MRIELGAQAKTLTLDWPDDVTQRLSSRVLRMMCLRRVPAAAPRRARTRAGARYSHPRNSSCRLWHAAVIQRRARARHFSVGFRRAVDEDGTMTRAAFPVDIADRHGRASPITCAVVHGFWKTATFCRMPVIGQTHCRRSSRRSSKGMYQSGTVIP